jgi:hypothetical protein
MLTVEKKCSSCFYGHQIVSFVAGGSVDEEGMEEHWHTVEPHPIGQTRNCYSWLEIFLFHPDKFIYLNRDDTCVNPKKFKAERKSEEYIKESK